MAGFPRVAGGAYAFCGVSSGQGEVGVELTFGIGYGDDIDKARKIILEVGNNCEYILDDPAQAVVVAEL